MVKSAVGTGTGAGADEDDFMVLKRRAREVEQEERVEEKFEAIMKAAERAPTRTQKAAPPAKKVVVF